MSRSEDYLDNLLNSVTSFKEELDEKTGVKDLAVKRQMEDFTDYDPELESLMSESEDDDEAFLEEFEKELIADQEDVYGDRKNRNYIPSDYTSSNKDANDFFDDIDSFELEDNEDIFDDAKSFEHEESTSALNENVPLQDESDESDSQQVQSIQEEAAQNEPEEVNADEKQQVLGNEDNLEGDVFVPEQSESDEETTNDVAQNDNDKAQSDIPEDNADEQELMDLLSGLSDGGEVSELSDLLNDNNESFEVDTISEEVAEDQPKEDNVNEQEDDIDGQEPSLEEALSEETAEPGSPPEAANLIKQEMEDAASEKEAIKNKKKKKDKKEKKKDKEAKGSFFERLKTLLFGEDDDEDEDESSDTSIGQDGEVSDENLELLKQLEGEDAAQEEDPKEKKKREKKEKKEQKEKEKKAKKAAKPKKEKKPKEKKPKKEKKPREKLPPVPIGPLIASIILALSIFALIYIFTTLTGNINIISTATEDFKNKNYIQAYEDIRGFAIDEEDEEQSELYRKIELMAFIVKERDNFYLFANNDMYELGLDALLKGVKRYDEYCDEAESLGLGSEYSEIEKEIEERLLDTYRLTKEQAEEIYSIKKRQDYTDEVYRIVEELGLADNE